MASIGVLAELAGLAKEMSNLRGSIDVLNSNITSLGQTFWSHAKEAIDDAIVSASAMVAAQFVDGLKTIRVESPELMDLLTKEAVRVQADLVIDDELVRQALEPLAKINLPMDQIREWAVLSVKVSEALGFSAEEISTIAGDLATVNVSAKVAQKAFSGFIRAARQGYMSISEIPEILKQTVELMGEIGAYGDKAFTGISRTLTALRAAFNTMGVPQWEQAVGKVIENIKGMFDFTNEQGQRMLYILSSYAGMVPAEFARRTKENMGWALEKMISLWQKATAQMIRGFRPDQLLDPRVQKLLAQRLEELYGIPAELAHRAISDIFITTYQQMLKAGKTAYEAQEAALKKVNEYLRQPLESYKEQAKASHELEETWNSIKGTLLSLLDQIKQLGHVITVSFGLPLLKVANILLKGIVIPFQGLVKAFIWLNNQTHGLLSFFIAYMVFAKSLTRLLNVVAGTGRVFDMLASKVPVISKALGVSEGLVASLFQRLQTLTTFVGRFASVLVKPYESLLQFLSSRVIPFLVRLGPILTSPYTLIGTALFTALFLFGKYEDQILAFIQDLPNKIERFAKQITTVIVDTVKILPLAIEKLAASIGIVIRSILWSTPKIIVAFIKQLPSILVGVIKGVAEALAQDFVSGFITALLMGFAALKLARVFLPLKLVARVPVLEVALDIGKTFVTKVTEVISGGLGKDLTEQLSRKFGSVTKTIRETVVSNVERIKFRTTRFVERFSETISSAKSAIATSFSKIISKSMELASKVSSKTFIEKFTSTFTVAKDLVVSRFSKLMSSSTELSAEISSKTFIKRFSSVLSKTGKITAAFTSVLGSAAPAIASVATKVGTVAGGSLLKVFGTFVPKVLGMLGEALAGPFGTILLATFELFGDQIFAILKSAFSKIKDVVKKTFSWMIDVGKKAFSFLLKWNPFVIWVKALAVVSNTYKKVFEKVFGLLPKWIKEPLIKVGEFFTEMWQSLKEKIIPILQKPPFSWLLKLFGIDVAMAAEKPPEKQIEKTVKESAKVVKETLPKELGAAAAEVGRPETPVQVLVKQAVQPPPKVIIPPPPPVGVPEPAGPVVLGGTQPPPAAPTPAPVITPPSLEAESLEEIASNTKMMVTLLRAIEANTRRETVRRPLAAPAPTTAGEDESLSLMRQGVI